jgi:ketosteroid isomerase-like protein
MFGSFASQSGNVKARARFFEGARRTRILDRRKPMKIGSSLGLLAVSLAIASVVQGETPAEIETIVAKLDTEYQAAVKANDAATMDRILADDFVLVIGNGKTFSKADLLQSARDKTATYEHQEELEQRVRVWGDTAVVTALLWIKGTSEGKTFERKLWFSDTYVRTDKAWRYVLGQASLPLPSEP